MFGLEKNDIQVTCIFVYRREDRGMGIIIVAYCLCGDLVQQSLLRPTTITQLRLPPFRAPPRSLPVQQA
jgi:hypothetical protein